VPTCYDGKKNQKRIQPFQSTVFNLESLYPNPVIDQLFVNIYSPTRQDTDVQVYDAVGKLMYEQSFFLEKGSNTLSLEMFNLPIGMYNLLIRNGANDLRTERFVKL